jgi:tetratricopeptide (TPR) repeat protein
MPVQKLLKETLTDEKVKMVNTYLQKGRYYETKKDMASAWTQYKLALTVDPQNQVANKNVKRLGKQLRNLAENHFQTGFQFLKKGQYRIARREFLLTLRIWPDHPEAVKMLSIRKRTQVEKYVEHIIKSGETLSKLATMYYGDYHHFTIIAEYNRIPDPTRVNVGQNIKIPEIEGLPFLAERQEVEIKQVSKADMGKLEEEIKKKEEIEQISETDVGKLEEEIKQYEEIKLIRETDWVGLEEETKKEEEKEETHEQADVLTMYLDRGIKLFKEDKYHEAIVEFNKFVNVNSDHETALEYLYKSHFQQGMFLFMKQDYLSAKKEFESSLQYKSDCEECHEYLKKSEDTYKEFHYVKGMSYFKEEKLTDALEEWELVWAIDPEYKEVEQNINTVKRRLKILEKIKNTM